MALRQEEIRRVTKTGSSSKGLKIKKQEEVDDALASMGKQEKRKKKELSKVKCFNCGHWVTMRASVRQRRAKERLPRARLRQQGRRKKWR